MVDILYDIGEWVIRLVMVPIVARQHRPMTAVAWLGFIFFIPWVGLGIYLLFGAYNLRRDVSRHARVREELETGGRLNLQPPSVLSPSVAPEHQGLVQVAEHLLTSRLGGLPVLGGNAVDLMDDTSRVIDRLVADIESAQQHVHLMFYHFEDGDTGRRVLEAMAKAAARGVQCRLLVDAYMSRALLRVSTSWMEKRHITVRTMLPLNPLRRPLARFDIRNHRKLAIIDGLIGYTGSQNIHNSDWQRPGVVWQQVMVRLTGPSVLQLQLLFVEDWYFATRTLPEGAHLFPPAEATGEMLIQTVPDGPTYPTDAIQHMLVEAIYMAKHRLILTSPYFVPDEPLRLALRLAALRGADVHIIIPKRSDRLSADLAARAFFQDLLDVGIHIHLHQRGVLHAKSMSVDDAIAMVGTANFDLRSLYLNYELALFFYSNDIASTLQRLQMRYIEESLAVDRTTWDQRPLFRQLTEHTLKLLSPLL